MNNQQNETLPEPPEYLGEAGKAKWNLIAAKVPGDMLDTLAMFCAAWELFLRSQADVQEHGVVLEGANGRTWNNPACNTLLSAQKQVQRLGRALGLVDEHAMADKANDEALKKLLS